MAGEEVKYTMTLSDLVSPKLKSAEESANRFETTLNKVTQSASKLGVALGIAFSITAVTAFTNSVIDAGSKVENARTGLTTLLKDSATANQVIRDTMVDATKTPFAFEGLLSANKALISAGETAEAARSTVINLSNAIAATGGGDDELQRMVVNLQAIRNTGVATATDVKQFGFAGINIYKVLANEIYHTTNANAKQVASVQDVKITYDLLSRALASAHETNGIYAGGLENMQNNTSVRLSNVGDAIFQFKVRVFDDFKPAIDYVISGSMSFINALSDMYEWSKDRLPGAIKALTSALKDVRTFAEGAAIGIAAATAVYAIANPIVIAYTASLVINGIATAGLTVATYAMTAAQWLLNAALTANPVGVVIVGIGLLVGGLTLAYKKSETFRAVLSGIGEVAKSLMIVFKGLGEVIVGAVTFNPALIAKGIADTAKGITSVNGAFSKGYEASLAESRANEAKETAGEKKTTTTGKQTEKARPTATTKIGSTNTAASKVTGSKTVNIHINIGSLIKDFKVETTNMKEGSEKIKEMVSKVLLSAVNDSQIVSGQ